MKIELFKGKDGWRWRLRAGNGEILATSEAYSSMSEARSTANMVCNAFIHGEDIVYEESDRDDDPVQHPVDEHTGLAAEKVLGAGE